MIKRCADKENLEQDDQEDQQTYNQMLKDIKNTFENEFEDKVNSIKKQKIQEQHARDWGSFGAKGMDEWTVVKKKSKIELEKEEYKRQ